jgi:hypothetical protein
MKPIDLLTNLESYTAMGSMEYPNIAKEVEIENNMDKQLLIDLFKHSKGPTQQLGVCVLHRIAKLSNPQFIDEEIELARHKGRPLPDFAVEALKGDPHAALMLTQWNDMFVNSEYDKRIESNEAWWREQFNGL